MLTIVGISDTVNYILSMLKVYKTGVFARWFKKLKDRNAKARIQARIDRLQLGYLGDVEPVGGGVSELLSSTALVIESISQDDLQY